MSDIAKKNSVCTRPKSVCVGTFAFEHCFIFSLQSYFTNDSDSSCREEKGKQLVDLKDELELCKNTLNKVKFEVIAIHILVTENFR